MTGVVTGGSAALLAVIAAGVAAALLVPIGRVPGWHGASLRSSSLTSSSRVGATGLREGNGSSPAGRWMPVLIALGVWFAGAGPVAGVVAGSAVVAGRRMLRSRRLAKDRAEASGRALEACVVLADEVRAGHSTLTALELAAEVDPELGQAYAAAVVGADVPTALRTVQVSEYRFLAAAWQVSIRHGGGLADALDRVVAQTRADRATARVVGSELASARATARLLVALPLFALLVGAGSGGRPWEFLLQTTPGVVCLVLGGALGWAGLAWIDAIADGAAG